VAFLKLNSGTHNDEKNNLDFAFTPIRYVVCFTAKVPSNIK
jgi:hypothetical protein